MLGSLLIVGTIRNVEKVLETELLRIEKATKGFRQVSYFLVESDSHDRTASILESHSLSDTKFKYVTMGNLSGLIPNRVERIRYCRNTYVEYIRSLKGTNEFPDYVFVVDLDGMNSNLTIRSIESCFERSNWDACFANQTFGFYDLYALDADDWLQEDIFELLHREISHVKFKSKKSWGLVKYLREDKIRRKVLYKRMRRISKRNDWIKVNSAFGGAGIYKASIFLNYDYSKVNEASGSCEHKDLNYKITRNGGSIYINPAFINTHFNTYNLNKIRVVRYLRKIKSTINHKNLSIPQDLRSL
jgi:hypothetical protein